MIRQNYLPTTDKHLEKTVVNWNLNLINNDIINSESNNLLGRII